ARSSRRPARVIVISIFARWPAAMVRRAAPIGTGSPARRSAVAAGRLLPRVTSIAQAAFPTHRTAILARPPDTATAVPTRPMRLFASLGLRCGGSPVGGVVLVTDSGAVCGSKVVSSLPVTIVHWVASGQAIALTHTPG